MTKEPEARIQGLVIQWCDMRDWCLDEMKEEKSCNTEGIQANAGSYEAMAMTMTARYILEILQGKCA